MTRYILTKFNQNIIAIILAFLLLLVFAGDQAAAHEQRDSGGERAGFEPSEPSIGLAIGTVFTVNSKGNASDTSKGDGQCDTGGTAPNGDPECTLRAAIEESNNLAGPETIEFNIRNADNTCPGLSIIDISTSLVIEDPSDAGVTIDGYSQCGAQANTVPPPGAGNAVIKIEVRGPQTSTSVGINIQSSNNTIKGLAVYKSKNNIQIKGDNSLLGPSPARNNTIQGNFICSNAALTYGSYGNCITIRENADYNLVGGVAPEERNIIVGGGGDNVLMKDKADFNVVIGNYIGVKQDGQTKGPGSAGGMDIEHGSGYNWFGASPPGWISGNSSSALGWPPIGVEWAPEDDPAWVRGDPVPPPDPNRNYDDRERNIISGNNGDGIEFSHLTGNHYNYVLNNYIGVDVTGTIARGNGKYGITVEDTPNHLFIYDNVIVNNGWAGIRLYGEANYNQVVNNYIGVAPDGVTPMGNAVTAVAAGKEPTGISVWAGSQHNLIQGNIIANHPDSGITISTKNTDKEEDTDPLTFEPKYIYEAFYNTITQNSIYNNQRGIQLTGDAPQDNSPLIGNEDLPAPQITGVNLISANGTACAGCTIEVFIAATNDTYDTNDGGEGKTFIGQGTADGAGNFSVAISGVGAGDEVTATATDGLGNTSEFGPNLELLDGEIPVGLVLLNGGTGLQSAYSDVLAQFSAADDNAVAEWRYWKDSESVPAYTSISPTSPFADEVVLTGLSEGPHIVYAQYKDNNGNESIVSSATITIFYLGDPSSPLVNGSITINNGAAYTNNPSLSLQLVGPLYAKDMKVDDDAALSGSVWEPYVTGRAWDLNDPYSGTQSFNYTVYTKYRNVYNTETSIVNDDILYDPVAPTISLSLDTDTKELDLTGSQDDAGGTGLNQMRIYDAGNHDSGWIAYQSSYTWPGPVGTTINVQLKDNAGNQSSVSSVELPVPDTTPPTGSILLNGGTGLQSVYNDVLAQFDATDDNAVAAWRYSIDTDINGVAWTNTSPTSPFSTQIDPMTLSDDPHTVYAQYKDDSGNTSSIYNATITIVDIGDPGDPANGDITINNGDLYTNDPNLSLQLIGPPPSFYTKDMKVGESSDLNGSSWEAYTVARAWALSNPPGQSQTVYMYARYRDENNAETSIVNDDILYDPVAPTVSVSLDTDTKELDLTGSQDDAGGSGLAEMRIYDSGNHDSGWIAYQTSYTWPGPEGTTINVQLRDNADNESTVSSVVLPSPDGVPVGNVLLNGGSGLQTTNSNVVGQFSATDDNAVAAWRYWKDSESAPSYTTISPISPFSTSENLSLSIGLHTVYAQYKDDNGNESAVYSATITIDAIPTGSILLNGGTGLQSTNSDVVAQFSANDNNAVTKWRYSIDADINGMVWATISSPGPTFLTTKDLNLSTGSHTVYAQYQDDNGNQSAVYSASITITPDGPPEEEGGISIYLPIISR